MALKFRWETKFKETEIGEIPKDWVVKEIGEEYKLQYGVTTSCLLSGNCKLLRMTDIKDDGVDVGSMPDVLIDDKKKKKYELKENDLVISRIANIGAIGIVNKTIFETKRSPIVFGSYLLRFRQVGGNTANGFIYYQIKAADYQEYLLSIAEGSTRLNTNAQVLQKCPLYLPLLNEQEKIEAILSWFDELIENKKRQNDILEKSAIAVFKSWFMDFEPFKKNGFKKSELSEIPSSCSVKPIGELADIHNGLSYSGKEKFVDPVEGSYVFITLNNAVEGGGFKTEYAWIRSDRLKDRVFLEESDLIIPNTEQTKDERLLGSPGLVVFPDDYKNMKGVFSHHISKITPHDQAIKYYLYVFLRMTREDSSSFHTGTGVLGLDIKNFRKNKMVVVAPKPIMDKYHALAEPIFQKIINNQKKILVLRKVRDTLLPLLVFGKLRVEEI